MMNLWVQLFYCHQPDSIWPQINFKLAIRTFVSGFPSLRYHKLRICVFIDVTYFVATSQIAYVLRLISNLQQGLSGHLTASPCFEEELTSPWMAGQPEQILFGFLTSKAMYLLLIVIVTSTKANRSYINCDDWP